MGDARRDKIEQIKKELSGLDSDGYHEILEAILQMMKRQSVGATGNARSLLELEGLGKDIWEKVDVEEYIRRERDSWD